MKARGLAGFERPRPTALNVVLVAALFTATASVHANPNQPTFGQPTAPLGDPRLREFTPALPESLPAEPAIPTPPVATPAPAANPAAPRLLVREIKVSGSTVFTDADFAVLTAPYVGREVSNEDLAALRQALTLKYVNAGYINSGAVLPDQNVADGVVEFRIVEGRLTGLDIQGSERLDADYLRERLLLGADVPLNVGALQAQMHYLLQGPFVAHIQAELAPGDRPGEARLTARVREGKPGSVSVAFDNDLSPSIGEARAVVSGQRFNLAGRGDILSGALETARGYTRLFADYSVPLNPRDTTVNVFADWTRADVVERPLNQLDIESAASTIGFRLTHPWRRSAREQLSLAVGVDLRRSRTEILGNGFAFSPGIEPDGESRATVVRGIVDYVSRSLDQVVAARSTLSWGVDAFNATDEGVGLPDASFVTWLGQIQLAQRVGKSTTQFVARLDAQLANDALLPLEQFAVGGLRTVRGYRKNQLVRDEGFAASAEFRVPVMKREDGGTLLEIVPFVDVGGAWFKERANDSPNVLKSAGLGVRFSPHPRVQVEVYRAHAFDDRKLVNPTDTLQDRGWHIVVNASLF